MKYQLIRLSIMKAVKECNDIELLFLIRNLLSS